MLRRFLIVHLSLNLMPVMIAEAQRQGLSKLRLITYRFDIVPASRQTGQVNHKHI
jgi:hypothetical protein